eukprot:CAMPEP_0172384614 /NCGR_PEP_ID=MMETSP1061-20121228/2349_1 /TAXON_ID=37318 /ORGANISM="Pseudo-nitzschia pungens, Strain cf. pungens" /LENGTH=213 /DNA_ID=CAMNT_0013113297 /DNA_START=48 /DNA_END=689 /DNA_ORIENTATION=+
MGLLTILKKVKEEEKEIRILVLGLDNAGKTTIVRRLCDRPIDEIEPTLGFSIQTLDYDLADDSIDEREEGDDDGHESSSSSSYKLHLWDIGGQSTIRAYWRNYFEKTDGIVWVVDSGDRLRLDLVREELARVLRQERLAGASLLIMANKSDLEGALSKEAIARGLRLEDELMKGQTHTRHWTIRGSSAVTGEGLELAMEWLVRDITDRIYFAA